MLKKGLHLLLAALSVFALICNLAACASNPHPKENYNVEEIFVRDYATLDSIATYLLSLEEKHIHIKFNPLRVMSQYGDPYELNDPQTKQLINELEEKGYYNISKCDGIVVFDVWRKHFNVEFEAGFAYSNGGYSVAPAVSFVTYQQPLSKENWCYYEADYNEWRVR